MENVEIGNSTQDRNIILKLNSLGPIASKENDVYIEALKIALDDKDMNNIALTGTYGSGKSSVIKSFNDYWLTDKETSSVIEISMLTFEEEPIDINKDGHETKSNQIEELIIKQLIYQIAPNKIPKSSFSLKQNSSFGKQIFFSLEIIYVTIYSFLFLNWDRLEFRFIQLDLSIFGVDVIKTLLMTIYLVMILHLCIETIKILNGSIFVKKMQAGILLIEQDSKKEDPPFNKYLPDIIYSIISSGVSIVIFEDIDRYDNQALFVRLRDLNMLINRRILLMKDRKSLIKKIDYKPIKFIYLVKDELFDSSQRTKLFDLIIPIVPIMNVDNSFDYLIKYKKENLNTFKMEDRLLSGFAIFIDDLRLLKNIINEYQIFYNKFESQGILMDSNELFSMVVYKNILPKDYSDMIKRKSYIDDVFKWMQEEREIYFRDNITLPEDRVDKIKHMRNAELYNELELNFLMSPAYQNYIEKNSTNEENVKFVHFLIENELITFENYRDYISMYLPESLKPRDKDFVTKVLNQNDPDFSYELVSPSRVTERIPKHYFNQKSILNFSLVQKMFEKRDIDEVGVIFSSSHFLLSTDFLNKYILEGKNIESLIFSLFSNNLQLIKEIIEKKSLVTMKYILSIQDLLKWKINVEGREMFVLDVLKNETNIVDIVSESYNIMTEMLIEEQKVKFIRETSNDIEEIGGKSTNSLINFHSNISRLKVEFYHLDSDAQQIDVVYTKSLYKATANNVLIMMAFAIDNFSGNNNDLYTMIEENEVILNHVNRNENFFLEDYISQDSVDYFLDSESKVLSILNNQSLSLQSKHVYANKNRTMIKYSIGVENSELKRLLFMNNSVSNRVSNIYDLFIIEDKIVSDVLINFVNNSPLLENDFSQEISDLSENNKRIFVSQILENYSNLDNKSKLDIRNIELMLKELNFSFATFDLLEIKDNIVQILINHNLIEMNVSNIRVISNYYPKAFNHFLWKNVTQYLDVTVGIRQVDKIELDAVLRNELITTADQINILSYYKNQVHIDPIYKTEVNEWLLDSNKRLDYSIDSFKDYDKLPEVIQKKVRKNLIDLLSNGQVQSGMTKEILLLVIGENLTSELKLSLISEMVEEFTACELVEIAKNSKIDRLHYLGTNNKIRMKFSDDSKKLMEMFNKQKLINSFSKNGLYLYGNASDASRRKVKNCSNNTNSNS